MNYARVVFSFAQLAVKKSLNPTSTTPSHRSAPSFLHWSISFLSAVYNMLLIPCPVLAIAISFPVWEITTSLE